MSKHKFYIKSLDHDNETLEVRGTLVAFKRAYCDTNEVAPADFEETIAEDGYEIVEAPENTSSLQKVTIDEII